MEKIKVLFVCLGNICRSPMAEAHFIAHVRNAGLEDRFLIDSAGTSGHHAGEKADSRMRYTAGAHGIDIQSRSRQLLRSDLMEFDYILAMDRSNQRNILALDRGVNPMRAKLHLMREFETDPDNLDVPDPYYGGQDGFEEVYAMLKESTANLLKSIRQEQGI